MPLTKLENDALSNTVTANVASLTIGANVTMNATAVFVGNSSVNTAITAGSIAVNGGTNVTMNTTTVFVGNSSVNTAITAGSIAVNGGAATLSQTFRGLTLRTHPDADLATSRVYLDHADEIVLNDGTRVTDWNDLTANITVSGAGGLDTGSEGASRWYEIHAIRKSSDGTKGLLLHRAKNYFLDESNTTATTTSALRDASAQTKRAQTFDTDVTGPVEFAEMRLTKVGSPTGQIFLSIYATSGGLPTGAALKTSDKLDVSLVSTSAQAVRFIFRDPQTVTAGTTYALVIEGDFTISAINYLGFDRSSAVDPYAAGQLCAYDGASWTGSSVDAWFKVYVTENDTAVTMPSGYNQRALVGWVYNNSSSNFSSMRAQDRNVFVPELSVVHAGTATIQTLVDLSALFPPVPVIWTSAQFMVAGLVSGTFQLTPSLGYVHYWSFQNETNLGNGLPAEITIPFEFQHCYYSTTRTIYLWVKGYLW